MPRNKGRTLTALGGIVLAVSLIAAANTSFDRAIGNILWAAFDTTPVDLIVWKAGGVGTIEEAETLGGKIRSMEEVTDVQLLAMLSIGVEFNLKGGKSLSRMSGVFGIAEVSDIVEDIGIGLKPSFPTLSRREVLFSTSSLSGITAEIGRQPLKGENLTLVAVSHGSGERWEWNLTYLGRYDFDYDTYWNTMRIVYQPSMIVGLQTCLDMIEKMGENRSGVSIVYRGQEAISIPDTVLFLASVDRAKFTHIRLLDQYSRELGMLVGRMETETGFTLEYASPVEHAARSYTSDISQARLLFLLSSVPAILLGIYVGMTAVNMWQTSRGKEAAILGSRGLERIQIAKIVFAESLVVGGIGGVAGVLLGCVLGDVLSVPLPTRSAQSLLDGRGIVLPSVLSLATGVCLAIAMAVAASMRAVRRDKEASVMQALRGYQQGISPKQYRQRTDLFLVLLPLVVYLLIMVEPQLEGPSLIGGLLAVLYPVAVALMPLAPMMMTYGVSRILTLTGFRPYRYLARIFSPIARDLEPVLEENLTRDPRASASLAILLALVVAFGTSMLAIASSYEERVKMENVFDVGSDIRVRLWNLAREEAEQVVSEISVMEGVEEATVVDMHYGAEGMLNMIVIAVDPCTLRTCIERNPYFTRRNAEVLDLLMEVENGAVVQGSGRAGSPPREITLPSSTGKEPVTLRVLGRFRSLPGTPTLYEASPDKLTVLTTHEAVEGALGPGRSSILLKLTDPGQAEMVAERIRSLHPVLSERWEVSLVETEDLVRRSFPVLSAVLSYTKVEFLFVLVMASLGLGLATYASYLSRMGEIARQIARGVSRGQLAVILCLEAVVISIMSIGVGLLAGTVPPYLHGVALARIDGIALLPSFSVPDGFLFVVGASFLALFLSSLSVSIIAASIRLDKVSRVRH